MAKFCGNCGKRLEEGAKVCGYCGTPVDEIRAENIPQKAVDTNKKKSKLVILLLFILVGATVVICILFNFLAEKDEVHKTMKVNTDSDIEMDTEVIPLQSLTGNMVYRDSDEIIIILTNDGQATAFNLKNNTKRYLSELPKGILGIWDMYSASEYISDEEVLNPYEGMWVLTNESMFFCEQDDDDKWRITDEINIGNVSSFQQNGWVIVVYSDNNTYIFDLNSKLYCTFDDLDSETKVYGYSSAFDGVLVIKNDDAYNFKLLNDWKKYYGKDLSDDIVSKEKVKDNILYISYEEYNSKRYTYTTFVGAGYGNIETYVDGENFYGEMLSSERQIEPSQEKIYCPDGSRKWIIEHAVYMFDEINTYYLSNGSVYTMGKNDWGQLGIGKTDHEMHEDYHEISNAKFVDLDLVSLGCCFALDEDGNIWAWGGEFYGYTPKIIISKTEYIED